MRKLRQPPEWWPDAWRRIQDGVTKPRIARDYGVSVQTVYKHVRRQNSGEYPYPGKQGAA